MSKLGSAIGELYEVGQSATCDSVCLHGLVRDCDSTGQAWCLLNRVPALGAPAVRNAPIVVNICNLVSPFAMAPGTGFPR